MSAPNPQLPKGVHAFREEYRAREIPGYYNGYRHLFTLTVVNLAAVSYLLSRVHALTSTQCLAIPLAFLVANLMEYVGHRFPMHKPLYKKVPLLYKTFKRHTVDHHRFFTRGAMQADHHRDHHIIFFPPEHMFLFSALFAVPFALMIFVWSPGNPTFIATAVVMLNHLCYEWLHYAYHSPAKAWVRRVPGVAWLSVKHTQHHDPAMSKYNFNVTFPIGDWLFGTSHRGEA